MSGYQIILITFVSLVFGLIVGWKVAIWHDQAVQLKAVKEAIEQTKSEQFIINESEKDALVAMELEKNKNMQITQEIKHDPKLVEVKLSPSLRKQLRSASMPVSKLP